MSITETQDAAQPLPAADLFGPGAAPAPGIYQMGEEIYHATDAVSKSGLWTLHKRTPMHYRYGERKETDAQTFGTAAHTAVLEPGLFENRFYRGPDNRRGNAWKAAKELAETTGRDCLTSKDYDDALRLRDALQKNEIVRKLTSGTPSIEQSAFWRDPKTGELCRVRPDIYNHDINVMADLKSTTDARAAKWLKNTVIDHGLHVQAALYPAGWQRAGGGAVDAFLFIVVEKEAPFAAAVYELPPRVIDLGKRIVRRSLDIYHACKAANEWPSYDNGVVELDFPKWAMDQGEAELDGIAPGLRSDVVH